MLALILASLFAFQVNARQTGVIAGQVKLPDGSPAVGIRVAAMAAGTGTVDAAGPIIAAALTETDGSGRYRLENILPGRYTVAAGLLTWPTYYPGQPGTDTAVTLSVAANSTTDSINFTLLRASLGFQIAGKLLNLPPNTPDGLFSVTLSATSSDFGTPLPIALVEPDGTFKFSRVPSGTYEVKLNANGSTVGSAHVVASQDIGGIELTAPAMLLGKVEMEEGGTLPILTRYSGGGVTSATASVNVAAEEVASKTSRSAVVRTDGAFVLFLSPGEHRFAVTFLPFGYYVKEMSAGGIDLLRQPLSVRDSSSDTIHLTLTRKPPDATAQGVTVNGRVIGIPADAAATSIAVSMSGWIPASMSRTGFEDRHEGQAPLRPDGTFEFLHVPPGRYTLSIWPRNERTAMFQESLEVEDRVIDITLGVRVRVPIQVVDETGSGIEGARVALLSGGYSPIADLITPKADSGSYLITGADGRTTFEGILGRRPSSILLVGYAPGRHASAAQEVPLDNAISEGLRLTMPTGIEIEGQIADPSGKTLVRALTLWLRAEEKDGEAWPYFYRVDTDSQGRFRLSGLHPGHYAVLSDPGGGTIALIFRPDEAWPRFGNSWEVPRHEPFEVLDGALEIRAGESSKTLRVSFEGREVSGTVVDETGKGVAGATVSLGYGQKSLTTDSEGRFREKIPPTEFIYLRAFHPAFGENHDYWYRDDSYGGKIPQQPTRLVLRRGFEIRGTLVDPAGKPLPNTPLELIPSYMGSGPSIIPTRTDANGHFSFGRMWVEHFGFHLNYDKLGHLALDFVGSYRELVDEAGWFDELKAGREITLKTRDVISEPVRGTLYGSDDKPLAWTTFRISVSRIENRTLDFVIGTDGRTDGQGQFQIGLWRDESYELKFEFDGQAASWKGKVAPGGVSGVRVELRKP